MEPRHLIAYGIIVVAGLIAIALLIHARNRRRRARRNDNRPIHILAQEERPPEAALSFVRR